MFRSIQIAFLAIIVTSSLSSARKQPPESAEVLEITKLEDGFIKADLAADVSYYERNLTGDFTAGTSWGTWYTKQSLLADLRNKAANYSINSDVTSLRVRVFSGAAIATFDQAYDAVIHGVRHKRNVLNTDVFVKQNGRWILAASHTSAAPKRQNGMN